MKIAHLVVLLAGLCVLTISIGCDAEHFESMLNEIYVDESEVASGESNSSTGSDVSSAEQNIGTSASNPETPSVINPESPIVPPVGSSSPNSETPLLPPDGTTVPPATNPVVPSPDISGTPVIPPMEPSSPEPSIPVVPDPEASPGAPPEVPVTPPTTEQPVVPPVVEENTPKPNTPVPNYMKEIGLNIPSDSERDPNQMYFAIKLKGESPQKRFFYQVEKNTAFGALPAAYPRGYEFTFHTVENGRKTFLVSGTETDTPGYTDEYGFSDSRGSRMETKYYIGHPRFKVPLKGTSLGRFSFANFVMIDYKIEVFGGLAKPDFCRVNASDPLTIEIPVDKYDPKIHKNVARVTIFFEPEKNSTSNFYTVIFDGFEPK